MERIRLTLEAGPDPLNGGRDADYRLKLVLKRLLRSYGFRCVDIEAKPTTVRGRGPARPYMPPTGGRAGEIPGTREPSTDR